VLAGPGPPTSGTESQAPPLDELRLHQGTVWRWNRAIYDPADNGHGRLPRDGHLAARWRS
jgi:hypothetical protein